jgi:hypothetical protein
VVREYCGVKYDHVVASCVTWMQIGKILSKLRAKYIFKCELEYRVKTCRLWNIKLLKLEYEYVFG